MAFTQQICADEIARRAEVTARSAGRWTMAPNFPTSTGTEQMDNGKVVRLYPWADVKQWLVDTGRWDAIVDMPLARAS